MVTVTDRLASASVAVLRGADLRNADLRGASVHCADFRGADLEGAMVDSPVWILDSGATLDADKWQVVAEKDNDTVFRAVSAALHC